MRARADDGDRSEIGSQSPLPGNRMKQYQEESGNLYNLEATPAEGTTYRFAKEDKKRYPGIV